MGGDDFEKRDSLSPIRKAVQEGIKEKEMANDARKASEMRNNEAMCNQIDYFLSGLCELFDVPEQIEKTIRQGTNNPKGYEFSLSVGSCSDYQEWYECASLEGDKKRRAYSVVANQIASSARRITYKLSEVLPNIDIGLLTDWIEKLYSIPSRSNAGRTFSETQKIWDFSSLSPHLRGMKQVPEQGTSVFLSHMKRYFFVLLQEGFQRNGIELQRCESSVEKIYKNNEKEMECRAVGDYIGSECKSSEECTGLCAKGNCNWAFNTACRNCKEDNWRFYRDDCTSRIENVYFSGVKLSFFFKILEDRSEEPKKIQEKPGSSTRIYKEPSSRHYLVGLGLPRGFR